MTTCLEQETLQMQRDHTMRHKYKISHLKRLAIRTLKVIKMLLLDRPYTSKLGVPGLSCGVNCVILCLSILTQYWHMTDRQMDT